MFSIHQKLSFRSTRLHGSNRAKQLKLVTQYNNALSLAIIISMAMGMATGRIACTALVRTMGRTTTGQIPGLMDMLEGVSKKQLMER